MIPEPYGGRLISSYVGADYHDDEMVQKRVKGLPRLTINLEQSFDADQIGIGGYSPLDGFMGKQEYLNVIAKDFLPSGLPWTMPVIFTPEPKDRTLVDKLKEGDEAVLVSRNEEALAILNIEDKYEINRSEFAKNVYGTTDLAHPNVQELQEWGELAVGGRITLLSRMGRSKFDMTPKETREYFSRMKWSNVAAYQARNPPHMAHEFIQRLTLERDDVDALFIQPVIGKLKKGDYKPEVIMRAYEAFVGAYYRRDRVLLSALTISMRYAGPKAVLFYTIVRRNYGCSHYIIGRDQAGVGSYYGPYDGQMIFDKYDVGVTPVKYDEAFFCKKCKMMVSNKTCPHGPEDHINISQTALRQLLKQRKELPREIIRDEVAAILEEGDVIN